MANTTTPARLEMRWVEVADERGRARLEMRWVDPGAEAGSAHAA